MMSVSVLPALYANFTSDWVGSTKRNLWDNRTSILRVKCPLTFSDQQSQSTEGLKYNCNDDTADESNNTVLTTFSSVPGTSLGRIFV